MLVVRLLLLLLAPPMDLGPLARILRLGCCRRPCVKMRVRPHMRSVIPLAGILIATKFVPIIATKIAAPLSCVVMYTAICLHRAAFGLCWIIHYGPVSSTASRVCHGGLVFHRRAIKTICTDVRP